MVALAASRAVLEGTSAGLEDVVVPKDSAPVAEDRVDGDTTMGEPEGDVAAATQPKGAARMELPEPPDEAEVQRKKEARKVAKKVRRKERQAAKAAAMQ